MESIEFKRRLRHSKTNDFLYFTVPQKLKELLKIDGEYLITITEGEKTVEVEKQEAVPELQPQAVEAQ